MAKLTTAQRKAAPHAGPGDSFPIPDKVHAIQALRMAHFAKDPSAIRAKVKAKFPGVGGGLNRHTMSK
jgi:hypothetical protein